MILLFLACTPPEPAGPAVVPDVGALEAGLLNPFPSVELVVNGHVEIPKGALPAVEGGTPFPVERVNWRRGFSPVQPAIARLPMAIDRASLGLQAGIGTGGSVRMMDMDSGVEIPVLAETDAWPDTAEEGDRTLIVRPMMAMTVGHRVAVAVTGAVTSAGAPLDLPPPKGHYAELVDELDGLGISDVRLAWDFPIGDGTLATRTIASAIHTPTEHVFEYTWGEGQAAEAVSAALVQGEGSFTVDNYLQDDTHLVVDETGVPARQGDAQAYLYVHVPASLKDAAPGSAPVIVFGHGILGSPDDYLANEDDTSSLLALANDVGAIVVATRWRGLTRPDELHAIAVAADFGRFPEVPDMLAQGVNNTLSLIAACKDGELLDDPLFGGLADRSRIYYYGISLGGIEGAVTLANQSTITTGVLHVGGSDWSTMLERSSQWTPFELLVVRGIPAAWDRQLLYAASQMLWDQVDPADYVEDLAGRTLLWQESIGDEQVPNITTELLQRSLGNPVGTPGLTTPYGIDPVALPAQGPAFTQYDAMVGDGATTNRPPSPSGAHATPRLWPGTRAQVVDFLTTGGTVNHHCGTAPCTAENTGE